MDFRKLAFGLFTLFSIIAFSSCDREVNTTVTDETDLEEDVEMMPDGQFVDQDAMQALASEEARSSIMEIKMAELVVEKSQHQGMRNLAQMIKDDHRNALEKLEEIAETNEWKLKEELTVSQEQKLDQLNQVSDKKINQAYLDLAQELHRKHINKFQGLLKSRDENYTRVKTSNEVRNARDTQSDPTDTAADQASAGPTAGEMNKEEGSSTYNDSDRNLEDGASQVKYGASLIDPSLKIWIANQLPVFQKHLSEIKEMQNKL